MDEFFKNNPNLFRNVNVDDKHSSFKGRQKMTIYNNNNNNNQLNYNKNQGRTSYKNIKNVLPGNRQNKQNSFIIGKFGKKTVVSQDLNTFLNKIKQAEWTTNTSYLLAKDINIKPVFTNYNNKEEYSIPNYSSKIDKYYLHLNEINSNDYLNYVNEIKNRKSKINQDVIKEKEEFMKVNFPNEGKLDVNTMLNRIRNNYQKFISNDQILYNKISQAIQH